MNVKITDIDGKKPSFVQWDVDRVLLISGVDSQPALHFANHELRRAIVVLAEEDGDHWKCKVPNFILQFECPFIVSVFLQPDEGKTVATAVFKPTRKMKPQDYEYEENIGYTNWVVKSEEVQNLIDTIQTMLDNGELKGDTGPGASVEVTDDWQIVVLQGQHQNAARTHHIAITDTDGDHEFDVNDPFPLKMISNKSNGQTNIWFYTDQMFPQLTIKDGEPPAVSVEETYYGNKVTFTDGTGPHTINVLDGMTDAVKAALLDLFQHVAYVDGNGQQYYDALYDAFNPVLNVEYITVAFNPGAAVIYNTYELAQLKPYLTVTAHYDDDTTAVVNDYTLSGTLATGTSAITATYGGKSAIFTVNVVEWLTGISATFSPGSATIYDTDSLDTLKQYLTVTATYADSTTATVTDYTLSGTLTEGSSTITVSYGGKTTTFSVIVVTPPYSLTTGTHTFTVQDAAKYVTISNGNHVKIGFPNVTSSGSVGAFINLSDLAKNQQNAKQTINNVAVNNLADVYFTIPNGASVKWEVKNISVLLGDMFNGSSSSYEFSIGFRKTNTTVGAINTIGYPTHTSRLTVEKTFAETTDVSCAFVYAYGTKAVDVEFDLYLTVNGERWI